MSCKCTILGPLVLSNDGDDYPGQSGPPTLIGVVSWGGSCGYASVFGRVSVVIDWIKKEMEKKCNYNANIMAIIL